MMTLQKPPQTALPSVRRIPYGAAQLRLIPANHPDIGDAWFPRRHRIIALLQKKTLELLNLPACEDRLCWNLDTGTVTGNHPDIGVPVFDTEHRLFAEGTGPIVHLGSDWHRPVLDREKAAVILGLLDEGPDSEQQAVCVEPLAQILNSLLRLMDQPEYSGGTTGEQLRRSERAVTLLKTTKRPSLTNLIGLAARHCDLSRGLQFLGYSGLPRSAVSGLVEGEREIDLGMDSRELLNLNTGDARKVIRLLDGFDNSAMDRGSLLHTVLEHETIVVLNDRAVIVRDGVPVRLTTLWALRAHARATLQ